MCPLGTVILSVYQQKSVLSGKSVCRITRPPALEQTEFAHQNSLFSMSNVPVSHPNLFRKEDFHLYISLGKPLFVLFKKFSNFIPDFLCLKIYSLFLFDANDYVIIHIVI